MKLIFLLLLVIISYCLGRFKPLDAHAISTLLVYGIAPVVFFSGMLTLPNQWNYLIIPVLFFCSCSFIAVTGWFIAKHWWHDNTRNIFAFSIATGNTGYFGIPIAYALVGDIGISITILATVGLVLYESTIGIFLTARGQFSAKKSFLYILHIPLIYAIGAGLLVNYWVSNDSVNHLVLWLSPFTESYSVLGMMMIGIVVAEVSWKDYDKRLLLGCLGMRFLVWPLVMSSILLVDAATWHYFDQSTKMVLILLSVVPLAANSIVFAVQLQVQPKKIAFVVLVSLFVSILIVPILFKSSAFLSLLL